MDAAVEYLRKNGQAKAEKKADRIAAEGLVDIVTEGNTAAIVEVNSETDFVANNDKFKAYVKEVANAALATKATDIDGFLADKWISDSSKTVKEALDEEIAVIGEKLSIRRFEKVTADKGIVVSYIHGGGRTVAMYVANLDVDTIDVGVPVLSMHAPYEIVSKIDVYMAYKAFFTFFTK